MARGSGKEWREDGGVGGGDYVGDDGEGGEVNGQRGV